MWSGRSHRLGIGGQVSEGGLFHLGRSLCLSGPVSSSVNWGNTTLSELVYLNNKHDHTHRKTTPKIDLQTFQRATIHIHSLVYLFNKHLYDQGPVLCGKHHN